MAKTAKQIQGDVFRLLKDSTLSSMISGAVYRGGKDPGDTTRPRDSRLEDAVVIFTTGIPDQIQTGTVTVKIYVPDIDAFDNGVLVEDGQRTAELEALADEWVRSLTTARSNYKFKLQQTIDTYYEAELNQHFVSLKLHYEYYGGED